MMKKSIFTACVLSLAFVGQIFAGGGSISHLFEGKSSIKAYVGQIKNESGDNRMSVDAFKKSLEDGLNNRKSTDFDTVNSPAESDIQIDAVVTKYQYLERGPFNPSPGIATTLADAAATASSNYVEMEVLYTITDTKTSKVLWSDDIEEYIKRVMTPAEGAALIYEKNARTFISRSFGSRYKQEVSKKSR